MRGLIDMLRARPLASAGGGEGAARYAGRSVPRAAYFARGGMADPEDEHEEVTPELKLAAYELLECLDSSKYGPGSDGKVGRAEAFAKHMLAFVRLSDEEPHVEGEHEDEGEHEGEGEGEDESYEGEGEGEE